MRGWFDRGSATSPVAVPCVAGCHTVARRPVVVIESLEARVVMSATLDVATVQVAPASAAATAGAFALGGNLQFQSDRTRDHALADLVKSSAGFRDLGGGEASVDADGWPTEDFTVRVWTQDVDPGEYRISFDGPATTEVSSGNGALTNQSTGSGVQNWVVDVPEGEDHLTLKFTGTAGQVKDLKVIQPNNADGQVWSTKYVNFLKGLNPESIRVMDLIKSNFNTTSTWAERPLPTDATFNAAGVPWEHVIALANELDTHLWIPVPVRATDDYVRRLAALIKSELNPNLNVYVEYSNETWSTLHEPGQYNLAQAKAEVAANPDSNLKYDGTTDSNKWQYRRNARRLKEIVELFREVWTTNFNGTGALADPVNGRVKAILGGKASEDERFDEMLEYIDENYGAPSNYFYGVGGAWYFSLNKYRDELIGGRRLSVDEVLEGFGISVGLYESERRFEITARKAGAWGLRLAAYEMGVDTMGDKNIDAKADAHRDPRVGPLMERFVRAFSDQGGVVGNWYTVGARPFDTPSGAWTVTESLDDPDSPKAEAFRRIRGTTLPPPLPPPPPPPGPGPAAPEVDVAMIEGGARTVLTDGQAAAVDFGALEAGGVVALTRTFEVRNTGTAALSLALATVPAGFEVVEGVSPSLAPGATDSFTLRMLTEGGAGERAGVLTLASNDADENPFTFAVRGVVSSAPAPTPVAEVTMLVNGTAVASGARLDLGTRAPDGSGPTLALTVRNDGGADLLLGDVTVPAGYALVGVPALGLLAPGEAAVLTLGLVVTDPGTYSGTVSIRTNDADEDPFTLDVTGEVAVPPPPPPPPPPPASGLTVAAVATGNIPAVLVSGGRTPQGTLSVTLRNDAEAFAGPVTVTIHASSDGVLDGGDAQLATATRTLKLGAGAAAKPMKFRIPLGALPAGEQTLLVSATATGVATTVAGPVVSVEPARVHLVGLPAASDGSARPLALGGRATLSVSLRNAGNVATTRAPVTYTLLFSTDGTEAGAAFSTTAAGRVSLKPGAERSHKLTLTLPPAGALASGTYAVLVRLTAELNEANGQTVALLPVTVV